LPDVDRLLSQCLSPAEIRVFNAEYLLDPLGGFYRYWTCKEACLKALGVGLARRLDSVRISMPAGDATGAAEVCGGSDETTGLFGRSFPPSPAIVLRQHSCTAIHAFDVSHSYRW
jgi:phosphopantetheinyl transferase